MCSDEVRVTFEQPVRLVMQKQANGMNNDVQWEYKLLVIKTFMNTATGLDDNLNEKFNELGADRWQLVEMQPVLKKGFFFGGIGNTSYTDSIVAVFKRIKST